MPSALYSDALGGCSSVPFSTYNIPFSHICGSIRGYQLATGPPEAFQVYSFNTSLRIEDSYVDGVVITRGTEKEPVWTFAASLTEQPVNFEDVCLCTNSQSTQPIPSFVGQDYISVKLE